jgi:hypothetical protein
MAALITFAIVMGLIVGAVATYFWTVIRGIRQEDRIRGSLQSDAPSSAARNARTFTGIGGSRWG